MERPDHELLHDFIARRDEAAFQALVRRHLNLVHAAARRITASDDLARDVTQSTFIRLARRATLIPRELALTAWLHRTCRSLAIDLVRSEKRRRLRERKAAQPQSSMDASTEPEWAQLAPVIDELVDRLSARDREIVLLRFYRNLSHVAVGEMLGLSEEAARKRSSRAVEKLRTLLARRGIATSAAALGMLLPAHAAELAPPFLATSVCQAAHGILPALPPGPFSNLLAMTSAHKLAAGAALLILLSTAAYTTPWRSPQDLTAARPHTVPSLAPLAGESHPRSRTERLPASPAGRLERLREILAIGDLIERRRELVAFLEKTPPAQFEEIARHFKSLDRVDRTDERKLMMLAWTRADAPSALAAALATTPQFIEDMAACWAAFDPDAAVAWARANSQKEEFGSRDGGNVRLSYVLAGIARVDPSRAMSMVSELPKEERRGALRLLFETMTRDSDPLESLLAVTKDDDQRGALITASALAKSQSDPAAAARLLMEHPQAAEASEVSLVFVRWAMEDDAAAGASLATVPGELLSAALHGVARQTAYRDLHAAIQLMEQYKAGLNGGIVHDVGEAVDLESRPDRVAQISWETEPGEVRDGFCGTSLYLWKQKDPAAARAWLETHEVSDDVRNFEPR
ncbi:MAG: hypothetical protein JWO82_3477 [Akkermansiaceae bacterium]|nr:hypothetical protein [Akkermansiaceae bacterium]